MNRETDDALRVTVLGAGNWGTTLARCIAGNGHEVRLWTRNAELSLRINCERENARSLAGFRLPPNVRALHRLQDALLATDLIFVAVPSQGLRALCRELAPLLLPEHQVVHCIKGLEQESHARMSEVLREETCVLQLGVLSGPTLALEVAAAKPAGIVIATQFPRVVRLVRRALSSPQLRVFESHDVLGVELCGAMKNVIAIAGGMADALEVGANARAFLHTRGLVELTRLLHTCGGDPSTPLGLAGSGDLMATATSPLSRNHRVGFALAKGVPLERALQELGMVAEGVYAARSLSALAQAHGLELPVIDTVAQVLRGATSVERAMAGLLDLSTGHDVPSVLRRGQPAR